MSNTAMRFVALSLLLLLASGCGYNFAGMGGEYINSEVKTVFVDTFANGTSEANLENTMRNAFINQIIKGRRFNIAESKTSADAIFRGRIKALTASPLSYDNTGLAKENRLNVTLELTFEDQANKQVIWQNTNFTGWVDYQVDNANFTITETNRKNALVKMTSDTADRAHSSMMSGF